MSSEIEFPMQPLPDGPVLEIGSRNVNGTVRQLFAGREYLGIDAEPGPGVDVVADGASYAPPFAPAIVVCTEVLEHAENAEAICRQAFTVLSPGGVFVLTAAGDGRGAHSAVDGCALRQGEFYRNVTVQDLCVWLRPFVDVRIQTNTHAKDIYATAVKPKGAA